MVGLLTFGGALEIGGATGSVGIPKGACLVERGLTMLQCWMRVTLWCDTLGSIGSRVIVMAGIFS